jgi:hypothetical protein
VSRTSHTDELSYQYRIVKQIYEGEEATSLDPVEQMILMKVPRAHLKQEAMIGNGPALQHVAIVILSGRYAVNTAAGIE